VRAASECSRPPRRGRRHGTFARFSGGGGERGNTHLATGGLRRTTRAAWPGPSKHRQARGVAPPATENPAARLRGWNQKQKKEKKMAQTNHVKKARQGKGFGGGGGKCSAKKKRKNDPESSGILHWAKRSAKGTRLMRIRGLPWVESCLTPKTLPLEEEPTAKSSPSKHNKKEGSSKKCRSPCGGCSGGGGRGPPSGRARGAQRSGKKELLILFRGGAIRKEERTVQPGKKGGRARGKKKSM